MRRKGLYLLACVFLLMVGCISNAEQKKAEASESYFMYLSLIRLKVIKLLMP